MDWFSKDIKQLFFFITKSSISSKLWNVHIPEMFRSYSSLYFWFFAIERQSVGTHLCRDVFLPKLLQYKDFSLICYSFTSDVSRFVCESLYVDIVWKRDIFLIIFLKSDLFYTSFHFIWSTIYIVLSVSIEFCHLVPVAFSNI